MLLSRVAERIYWSARYVERAEDTARLVSAHGDLAADLPSHSRTSWEPLLAVVGSDTRYEESMGTQQQQQSRSSTSPVRAESHEMGVTAFLLRDRRNPASIASCVTAARENLRTTRETVPRESWRTLNDLYLYVSSEADRAVDRRIRPRFLGRVIADSRRLDGVLATSMTHDEAYVMWRLGRAIERADMTTRVLGVRAAAVLSRGRCADGHGDRSNDHDEVQWMGVLRSVQGLQMYQRAVRGPIEGPSVVHFLLDHDRFPRAVRALLREIRRALGELPDPGVSLDAVDHVEAVLRESTAAANDGVALDSAMDALQVAIAQIDRRITDRYLRTGS